MALGYKYYRQKLIELMILSVGGVAMFWDYFKGRAHPDTEPAALVLVACLFVFGNVGLFIAMRRVKLREIKASAAMKKNMNRPQSKSSAQGRNACQMKPSSRPARIGRLYFR